MSKGISLHIGINEVDKYYYYNLPPLRSAENDAKAMEQIASECQYITSHLFSKDALKSEVFRRIIEIRASANPGDIFLLTYSGHGSRIPDTNYDETGEYDQSWCLFDTEILDDEINRLLISFNKDVRILVISDSCYSGTIIKKFSGLSVSQEIRQEKSVPASIQDRIIKENRQYFSSVQKYARASLKSEEHPCILLLSASQDNSRAYGGDRISVFTQALIDVWNQGKFSGNYRDFLDEINKKTFNLQIPNLMIEGREDIHFLSEIPFSI
jgi:metacaspase-1